jgi:hypothetical protein
MVETKHTAYSDNVTSTLNNVILFAEDVERPKKGQKDSAMTSVQIPSADSKAHILLSKVAAEEPVRL